MIGLLEPVLERVVYEDIPFNLAAVKQRVEDRKLQRRIIELEEQGKQLRAYSSSIQLGINGIHMRLEHACLLITMSGMFIY